MQYSTRKDNDGMALILAVIFLLAMGMVVSFTATRIFNNAQQVAATIDFQDCFQGLESGLASAKAELKNISDSTVLPVDKDGRVGVDPTFNLALADPAFGDLLVTPNSLTTAPALQYFAYARDWATDGIDNNGDGLIDFGPETLGYYSIHSQARIFRNNTVTASRIAEEIVRAVNVNVWKNAIFAGAGQSGNLINGNVSVHGSVHLLGTNLSSGGVAIAAIDMSGTSMIHNNYDGLSTNLRDRIPALPVATVEGEVVETLNAILRVKKGLVGLSGNSEVGQPQALGDGFKEMMDGIYVTDGWSGNSLDANGNPTSVYSDNGFNEAYDLGNAVPFPNFTDDAGLDYLDNYLQTDAPGTGLQFAHPGPMTINAGQHYFWNATTGTEIIGTAPGTGTMPAEADLDPTHYYVWFDADTNRMLINGRIPIEGDLLLEKGNGNDKTINYSGKGTFMAQDNTGTGSDRDVIIQVNLYAQNLDGTTTNAYPQNNLIGFMAENDLIIGDTAQLDIMGGFYAQNSIVTNKQTTILGTLVGDSFNMGTNVPDVYQVPQLADSWDPNMRMIGAAPVITLTRLSWRELGVR